jgi:hypothetical protein
MRKLPAILAALGVLLACSVASAGWTYVAPAPVMVYRPVAPVVTYYAPPVAAVPVAPSPIVPPAPVVAPTPVLTPQAVMYPGTVVYPAPAYVPARVYYRPARGVYRVVVPY